MAKIPGGEAFGQVVARPQQAIGADPQAYGVGVGSVLQEAGQMGMRWVAAKVEAEHSALKKAQEERDRMTAVTTLDNLKADFNDTGDELVRILQAGEIKPADLLAEFDKRTSKMLAERTKGLPGEMVKVIEADTIAKRREIQNRLVDQGVAVTRQQLRGDIRIAGEASERRALENRPAAVAAYANVLEVMGPKAGMNPDEMVRELQTFKEKTAYSVGDALVRAARDDMGALDGLINRLRSPEFSDLSPDRLGQLEARVLQRKQFLDNQRTQAVIRAQAQAQRRENAAERAMGEFEKMVDSGYMPDAQTMKQFAEKISGTSYAPRMRSMVAQAGDRAGFAQLSPDQQRAKLMELRGKAATEGTNPDLQARIARYETIQRTTDAALADDAITHGARTGLVVLEPLDLTNLANLGAQLAQRSQAADTLAARFKRDVSPLTKEEAQKVGNVLQTLAAPDRERAVVSLAKSMTPSQAQALAKQINDREPALGLAMFQAAANPTGPALPLILRGQDAKKAGRIKDDEQSKRNAQDIARQMQDINWGTPAARDYATQTAVAILDGMRDQGGASVREAVKLATGGIGEWADSKVPLPPGMDSRQFERRLEDLARDPGKLAGALGAQQVRVGDKVLTAADLSRQLGRVNLISAGPGRYALEAGGQVVLGPNGRPIRLDLRK